MARFPSRCSCWRCSRTLAVAGCLAALASGAAGGAPVGEGAELPRSAEEILAAQPDHLRERLDEDKVVMLQEFGAGGEVYGSTI